MFCVPQSQTELSKTIQNILNLSLGIISILAIDTFFSQTAQGFEDLTLYKKSKVTLHKKAKTTPIASQSPNLTRNDVYLYGESSQLEEIGKTYMTFAIDSEKQVVGAFYMPNSEFSCFYGTLKPKQLVLSIVDPYTQEIYDYEVATEASHVVSSEAQLPVSNVEFPGFHKIETLNENTHNVLNTCQGNLLQMNLEVREQ